MHNDLRKEGVATISVSLDNPTETGVPQKVRKFLTQQKATFPNYILDEKEEVWQEKLKISGPPCVFVFDRDGKIAKKFDSGEKYDDEIIKFVKALLKEKK